jgi:hypothetical protein
VSNAEQPIEIVGGANNVVLAASWPLAKLIADDQGIVVHVRKRVVPVIGSVLSPFTGDRDVMFQSRWDDLTAASRPSDQSLSGVGAGTIADSSSRGVSGSTLSPSGSRRTGCRSNGFGAPSFSAPSTRTGSRRHRRDRPAMSERVRLRGYAV